MPSVSALRAIHQVDRVYETATKSDNFEKEINLNGYAQVMNFPNPTRSLLMKLR
jgi:hypothetical protein